MQIHITKVQGRSVYGHSTEHCEDGGCAGHEYYFPGLDPEDIAVHPGSVIDSGGSYYLAPADDPSNVAAAGPANEFTPAREAFVVLAKYSYYQARDGKPARWRLDADDDGTWPEFVEAR